MLDPKIDPATPHHLTLLPAKKNSSVDDSRLPAHRPRSITPSREPKNTTKSNVVKKDPEFSIVRIIVQPRGGGRIGAAWPSCNPAWPSAKKEPADAGSREITIDGFLQRRGNKIAHLGGGVTHAACSEVFDLLSCHANYGVLNGLGCFVFTQMLEH